jgi:hypothetical protein
VCDPYLQRDERESDGKVKTDRDGRRRRVQAFEARVSDALGREHGHPEPQRQLNRGSVRHNVGGAERHAASGMIAAAITANSRRAIEATSCTLMRRPTLRLSPSACE